MRTKPRRDVTAVQKPSSAHKRAFTYTRIFNVYIDGHTHTDAENSPAEFSADISKKQRKYIIRIRTILGYDNVRVASSRFAATPTRDDFF